MKGKEVCVISIVLDEILAVTQIDPSVICPDDTFQEKWGLSERDLLMIYQRAGWKLNLKLKDDVESLRKSVSSPREMVELLKSQYQTQSMKQAA